MSFFALTIIGTTLGSSIIQQIDALLLIRGNGSPVGTVAAALTGQKYYDYTNNLYYRCTVTDGSGNPANTTWAPLLNTLNVLTKSTNFNVSDGPGAYYRSSGTNTATLPASPADGSVRKFKCIAGTITFVFNGSDQVNHAAGTSDQTLSLVPSGGILELIAVTGGWDANL